MADDNLDDAEKRDVFLSTSANLARARHADYDNIAIPVIARAQKDEKLKNEILSADDPAEYTYELGRKEKDGDLDELFED